MQREISLATAFFALFISFIWGGNIVTIKVGLDGIPPVLMAGIRFSIGAFCIFIWANLSRIPLLINDRKELVFHLINGAFFMSQISLLYLGMTYTTASHGSLLINTNNFFVAIFAHFFIPQDRMTIRKASGLILAFLGVFFVFYDKQYAGSFSLTGDILIFLSAFLLGLRIIYIKKRLESLDATKVVFWEFTVGVPLFFIYSLFFEGGTSLSFTLPVTMAVLYQGIIVAGFCFVASTILLQRHSPTAISSFTFAIPVSGIFLSYLFLGDLITKNFILGSLLVVYGIYLVSTKKRKRIEA